jgi:hypothetical protein
MSLTTKGLEELVKKFDPATNVRDVVKITDVQPVASYSWIEANSPTIAIPGTSNFLSLLSLGSLAHQTYSNRISAHLEELEPQTCPCRLGLGVY